MLEVVDRWHRESGKGLVGSDARGGTGQTNSEDGRAIITKIAGNCVFPFYLFLFPLPPFPFI